MRPFAIAVIALFTASPARAAEPSAIDCPLILQILHARVEQKVKNKSPTFRLWAEDVASRGERPKSVLVELQDRCAGRRTTEPKFPAGCQDEMFRVVPRKSLLKRTFVFEVSLARLAHEGGFYFSVGNVYKSSLEKTQFVVANGGISGKARSTSDGWTLSEVFWPAQNCAD